MSLRGRMPEAIQLLPILQGRKLVKYKSPKCPVLVMKMSTNLHILSNYLHSKVGLTLVNHFKILGRLKSTLLLLNSLQLLIFQTMKCNYPKNANYLSKNFEYAENQNLEQIKTSQGVNNQIFGFVFRLHRHERVILIVHICQPACLCTTN